MKGNELVKDENMMTLWAIDVIVTGAETPNEAARAGFVSAVRQLADAVENGYADPPAIMAVRFRENPYIPQSLSTSCILYPTPMDYEEKKYDLWKGFDQPEGETDGNAGGTDGEAQSDDPALHQAQ